MKINWKNIVLAGGAVALVVWLAKSAKPKTGLQGVDVQYYKGKAIVKNNDGSYTVKHGSNKPSTVHKTLAKAKRRIDFNKSKSASAVLQLMDKDYSYSEAVNKVLSENRNLTREKLEKELNPFI